MPAHEATPRQQRLSSLRMTGAPPEAHEKLMSVLKYTGANFTTLDIAKHDRCASVISQRNCGVGVVGAKPSCRRLFG